MTQKHRGFHLGELLSATVTLDSMLTGAISVCNANASAMLVDSAFVSNLPIVLTGPEGTSHTYTYGSAVSAITAAPGLNYYNASSDHTSVTTGIGNLTPYRQAGGGPLNLSLVDSATGTFGGSSAFSNLFFGGNATASGSVTITYSFAPIPEPSTYTVLLGLLTLGGVALRRRTVTV